MKFTSQKPKVPGAYWWRARLGSREVCLPVYKENGVLMVWYSGPLSEMNGEWSSLLVPVDEISSAYSEGYWDAQNGEPEFTHSQSRLKYEGKPLGDVSELDGEAKYYHKSVSVEEVRKSFDEGFADAHGIWEDSRARRVFEGKEDV
ncbi:MAG: hypothetical protein WCG75_00290 [Armatimonadota bacterium]